MSATTSEAAAATAVPEAATRAPPRWLWQVCLATATYLAVELAFNARLLDVVGGGASADEIDHIEVWGRVISGFALALVFWPALINRAARKFSSGLRRGFSLATWTLVTIIGMYAGQEILLNHLVDQSSPQELREAQHLVLLQSGISNNVAYVDSLELDAQRIQTAEGKATLALLPILASHMDDVGGAFTDDQRHQVARNVTLTLMGDPNERLENYSELTQALFDGYGSYDRAMGEAHQEAQKAWADYRKELRSKRLNPDAVPRRHHSRVRSEVRSKGIWVDSNWNPSDRNGFLNAATRQPKQEAKAKLAEGISELLPGAAGISLPDTAQEFLTDTRLNGEIYRALGYTCMTPVTGAVSSGQQFKTQVFDREVDCLLARQAEEDGDTSAGRTAMRALLVPFIALVFSLLGALAHVTKLSLYVLTLIKGYPLFKRRGGFALLTLTLPALLVTLFAWTMSSTTTSSLAFEGLEDNASWTMRTMIRGTIHGQMVGYPIFEGVRVHLLRGFEFGYAGESEVAAEDTADEEEPGLEDKAA